MDMPQLSDGHRALTALIGTWTGEEELAASAWAPASTAVATVRYRLALNGFAVIQDYEQRRADGGGLLGHNVFTVDPASGDTLWYGFDSYGFPPLSPGRGGWDNGTLELEKRTTRGVARHRLTPDGDVLNHVIVLQMGEGTEFGQFLSARYIRESAT